MGQSPQNLPMPSSRLPALRSNATVLSTIGKAVADEIRSDNRLSPFGAEARDILILDDMARIRQALRFYIESMLKLKCHEAATVSEAIRILENRSLSIELMIQDWNRGPEEMPGFENCDDDDRNEKFIRRALEIRPNLKVLVFSGMFDQEMMARAYRAGAFHCGPKPVKLPELERLIRAAWPTESSARDSKILKLGARLGALYVEAGAVKFDDWARALWTELGDAITPYLKGIYKATAVLTGDQALDNRAVVDTADLSAILSEEETSVAENTDHTNEVSLEDDPLWWAALEHLRSREPDYLEKLLKDGTLKAHLLDKIRRGRGIEDRAMDRGRSYREAQEIAMSVVAPAKGLDADDLIDEDSPQSRRLEKLIGEFERQIRNAPPTYE